MTEADLIDHLAAHKTVGPAPREELAWLAAHGSLQELNTGEVLSSKGESVRALYIVLTGRIAIFVDRGAGLNKVLEWREGDVTGLLPYSRLTKPPGDTVAQEPTTLLAIDRSDLRAMIRECHEITTILVHLMLDRSRLFTSSDLHDEKMVSLGKLSAGLAHELNNPASAIERAAALLVSRLAEAERATRALDAAGLNNAQLAAAEGLHGSCLVRRLHGVGSPIERAEREEAIADWLADHGLEAATADALVEAGVTFESLDAVAQVIEGPRLNAVLEWAASACSVRSLASDIHEAATRISGLVGAVKGYTHMDQAMVAEPVDLVQGLTNTVAVLKSKARDKSAAVVVKVDPDLPRVRGFAGELNQIWSNLIDNALDAVGESGRVEVLANREGQRVVVRIVDNGIGIPETVREHIFDPFFTTKPVGQGTGLGLDIVWRLLRHNEGDIVVESRPGRTEFRVVLPAVASSDTAA